MRDDVLEECSKYGGVVYLHVDKYDAKGLVYVKFQHIGGASGARSAMNGRFFAGRQVSAAFVPEDVFYKHCPNAKYSTIILKLD